MAPTFPPGWAGSSYPPAGCRVARGASKRTGRGPRKPRGTRNVPGSYRVQGPPPRAAAQLTPGLIPKAAIRKGQATPASYSPRNGITGLSARPEPRAPRPSGTRGGRRPAGVRAADPLRARTGQGAGRLTKLSRQRPPRPASGGG